MCAPVANSANKLLADTVLTRFQEKQPISHLFNSAPPDSKFHMSREIEIDDPDFAEEKRRKIGDFENH